MRALFELTEGQKRLEKILAGFPDDSPHWNEAQNRFQFVDRLEERDAYKVPLHEFTKHALLGEYAYFNSQSSLVACNIFDVSSADPREHFLASLIITYLSSNIGIRDNDGFINGVMIVAELARHGFIEQQVRFALRRLAEKRLIETPHAHYREVAVEDSEHADQFHFRATSVGIYHVRYWTGEFAFMDAVSIDTPIFDEDARSNVMKLAASFDISDRFDKTIAFQTYLELQWQAANISADYYDFSELIKANSDSIDRVKVIAERGGGPLFRPK